VSKSRPLGARPGPICGFRNQTRADGVPFDILHNSAQFAFIPNPAVPIFAGPEVTGATQDFVRSHGGGSFQPTHGFTQFPSWLEDNVDMSAHDDPGDQPIRLSYLLPIQQSFHEHLGDLRPGQPHLTPGRSQRRFCRRFWTVCQERRRLHIGTAGQTPGYEYDRIFGDPVGQASSPEHEKDRQQDCRRAWVVASVGGFSRAGLSWVS
jgi:hypothetical protein